MEHRIPASAVQPGDVLVSIDMSVINSTVTSVDTIKPGARLVGPRGGRYEVTRVGSEPRIILRTGQGNPVVRVTAAVVVYRNDEDSQ